MLKVLAGAACLGATVSADPWVPLTISWHLSMQGGPLRLYLTGDEGGYVELNVSPDSGALSRLVLVNVPPTTDRIFEVPGGAAEQLSPVLDLGLWEWKVTPDYREPASRDAELSSTLTYSKRSDEFTLWFSGSPVVRIITCGKVCVGVSQDNEMVAIRVPTPEIVEPELFNV